MQTPLAPRIMPYHSQKAMENVNLEVHNNGKLQNKYYMYVCFETRPCRFYWFLHSQLRNCFTCI